MKTTEDFNQAKKRFKYTYSFEGVIHPERTHISFDSVRAKSSIGDTPDILHEILIELTSKASKFDATVYSNTQYDDLATFRNLIRKFVETRIDELCFLEGMYLEAEFVSLVLPSGERKDFGVEVPAVKSHAYRKIGENKYNLRKVLIGNNGVHLRQELSDYKKAMKYVSDYIFIAFVP